MVMTAFAFIAGAVFGTVSRDSNQARLIYGLKVFGEFMAFGLAFSWLLYFLPF
jgi:hypothetical protein